MNPPTYDPNAARLRWVKVAFIALAVLTVVLVVVSGVTAMAFAQDQQILVSDYSDSDARDAALERIQYVGYIRAGVMGLVALLSVAAYIVLGVSLPRRSALAWLAAAATIVASVIVLLQGYFIAQIVNLSPDSIVYVSIAIGVLVGLINLVVLGLVLGMTFPFVSNQGIRIGSVVVVVLTTLVMLGLSLIAVVGEAAGLSQSPLYYERVAQISAFAWSGRELAAVVMLFAAAAFEGTLPPAAQQTWPQGYPGHPHPGHPQHPGQPSLGQPSPGQPSPGQTSAYAPPGAAPLPQRGSPPMPPPMTGPGPSGQSR